MFARSKLVPELMVSDIQKSLHFWTSLIGFQIAYERPESALPTSIKTAFRSCWSNSIRLKASG